MKTKSFVLLFDLVLLAALILSACTPADTAAPAAAGSIVFPTQIAGGRDVEISVVGMPAGSQ